MGMCGVVECLLNGVEMVVKQDRGVGNKFNKNKKGLDARVGYSGGGVIDDQNSRLMDANCCIVF